MNPYGFYPGRPAWPQIKRVESEAKPVRLKKGEALAGNGQVVSLEPRPTFKSKRARHDGAYSRA